MNLFIHLRVDEICQTKCSEVNNIRKTKCVSWADVTGTKKKKRMNTKVDEVFLALSDKCAGI